MAEVINTNFGKVFLDPGFGEDGLRRSNNLMALQTESVINFFRAFSVIKGDITKNQLGLYSYGSFGSNKKMRFGSFRGGNHLWQKRQNGCAWNGKGSFTNNITEVATNPMEAQIEICPDSFWGNCWEKLMDVGNGKRDLYGTPEMEGFMGIVLDEVFKDLGDGFYDISWFGQHPYITQADDDQTYQADSEEQWMDYLSQQEICSGFLTYDDYYRHEVGLPQFNVQIQDSEVNGETFTGDPTELFKRLDKAARPDFQVMNTARNAYAGRPPMRLVTGSIFDAYEEWLLDQHGNIPQTLEYNYNGEFCASLGCIGGEPIPGILKYKGVPVVRMDEWDRWSKKLGIIQHRAMLVPPGIFGLGWDVNDLNQYSGMGLMINQKLEAPDMGKVYLHSLMEMATALVDVDFITSAAWVAVPE